MIKRIIIGLSCWGLLGAVNAQNDQEALKWVQNFFNELSTAKSYVAKVKVSMLGKGQTKPLMQETSEAYFSDKQMLTIMPGRTALLGNDVFLVVDAAEKTIYRQERHHAREGSADPGSGDAVQQLAQALKDQQNKIKFLCADEQTLTVRITDVQPGYEYTDVTFRRKDHMPTKITYALAQRPKKENDGIERIEVAYTELKLNVAIPAEKFNEGRFIQRNGANGLVPAKGYEGYHIIRSNES